jgi:hypothetical protein
MSDTANTYRVVKVPQSLLDAMRQTRDQAHVTNARFLADAINNHLPGLIAELTRLGFGARGESLRAARLPFSDESGTLGLLKEAGDTVGLPATTLLELCLRAAVRPREEPKRRRGRSPKSDESAGTEPTRTRRRRRTDTSGNS